MFLRRATAVALMLALPGSASAGPLTTAIERAGRGGARTVCWLRQPEARALVRAAQLQRDIPVADRGGPQIGLVQYFPAASPYAVRGRSVTRLLRCTPNRSAPTPPVTQESKTAATRTDPQGGKLHTEHYEVDGPVVIVLTPTSPEAFDEEKRSRFVQLTMDESAAQTKAILERQRRSFTLEGVLERATAEAVQRLHHNAQRLLRPLAVVNPYVEQLTYPSDRLMHRREQKKYLALINAIALLHQHQREVKRAARGDVEIEYVEVTIADIALANELAQDVLSRGLDELAAPVRGLYEELRKLCVQRAEEMNCQPDAVLLSRREIREATGWSDWQVRSYCRQLVEMEYLYASVNGNGRPCVYSLARAEENDVEGLRGLTDVAEIRQRLKEKAAG